MTHINQLNSEPVVPQLLNYCSFLNIRRVWVYMVKAILGMVYLSLLNLGALSVRLSKGSLAFRSRLYVGEVSRVVVLIKS